MRAASPTGIAHESASETESLLLTDILSQLQQLQTTQAIIQRDIQQARDAIMSLLNGQSGEHDQRAPAETYEVFHGSAKKLNGQSVRAIDLVVSGSAISG